MDKEGLCHAGTCSILGQILVILITISLAFLSSISACINQGWGQACATEKPALLLLMPGSEQRVSSIACKAHSSNRRSKTHSKGLSHIRFNLSSTPGYVHLNVVFSSKICF